MNINESLQTFLNYNFESSAKKTGRVLAVIETKCGKKTVKQLKCFNLKELGLLAKIKLWWHNSLKLKNLIAFTDTLATSSRDERVNLEKQQARLNKKVVRSSSCLKFIASYRPRAQWNLNVTVHFLPTNDGRNITERKMFDIPFDRLTTNEQIFNRISQVAGTLCIKRPIQGRSVHFGIPLLQVFNNHIFQGDYQGIATRAPYLQDGEAGGQRSVILNLEDFNEQELEKYLALRRRVNEDILAVGIK